NIQGRAAKPNTILLDAHRDLCDVYLGRTLVIASDDLINRSNLYQAAFLQEDRPIAHRLNQRIRVTGEHKDAGTLDQGLHASLGAGRKSCISCTQPFIEQQDVRFDCSCDRKAQACDHAGRVGSNRKLEIFAQFAEIDDIGKLAVDLLGTHTEKHTARLDVLVSIVVRIKAGSGIEQRGNTAIDAEGSRVRRVDSGEYFQQRGFPSPVVSDQSEPIAVSERERDIIERTYDDALLTARPLVPD